MSDFMLMTLSIGLGTYGIRASFILFSSKVSISPRIKQIFSFIPAAVFSALIAPMVFFHEGKVDILLGYERLIVLLFSTVFAYYVKNIFLTVLFGLIILYFLILSV